MDNGELHQDFLNPGPLGAACPVGRTLDLAKAYKNLAPSPSFAPLLVIALWHPGSKTIVYYRLLVLALGARNSVFAFAGFGLAMRAAQQNERELTDAAAGSIARPLRKQN